MVGDLGDMRALKLLARKLADPRMPIQLIIAKEAGVPQSVVSRALNGKLARVTGNVRRLIDYANSRIPGFSGGEGAPDLAGSTRPLAAPSPLRTSGDLGRDAEEELRDYLRGGYDPGVIIAQIDLLRRAQRIRRLGRTVGGARRT